MAFPNLLRGESTRVTSGIDLMLVLGTNVVVQKVVEEVFDNVAPTLNLVLGAAIELILEARSAKSGISNIRRRYVEYALDWL